MLEEPLNPLRCEALFDQSEREEVPAACAARFWRYGLPKTGTVVTGDRLPVFVENGPDDFFVFVDGRLDHPAAAAECSCRPVPAIIAGSSARLAPIGELLATTKKLATVGPARHLCSIGGHPPRLGAG